MIITSKSNPVVKEIVKLSADRKYRQAAKKYVVEGIKPVKECLQSGQSVSTVVCVEKFSDAFEGAVAVSESVFGCISSEKTPQGVLAVVNMPENELKPPEKSCILLDRIQDPGNLGTIIRTANAAGYDEIYLLNCTDPYSPKAVRASMSGIFFVNTISGSAEEILPLFKGVSIICADMDGEDIFSFTPPEKFCLCIGNEGGGVSREIMDLSKNKIKIPMRESCESLNAAVSCGIAMYLLKYRK